VTEAVTGVIAPTTPRGDATRGLPDDVVVVEVEPGVQEFGRHSAMRWRPSSIASATWW
jgi:hypothetical protein